MIPSWIHLSKNSGDKNDTTQVVCDANTSVNARSVEIVVATSNRAVSKNISITQKGLPDSYLVRYNLPEALSSPSSYVNKRAYLAKKETTSKGDMVAVGTVQSTAARLLTIDMTYSEITGIINVLNNSMLAESPKLYLYAEKEGLINPELIGTITKQVSGFASEYLITIYNKYVNQESGIEAIPVNDPSLIQIVGQLSVEVMSSAYVDPYAGSLEIGFGVQERGTTKYYEFKSFRINANVSTRPHTATIDLSDCTIKVNKDASPILVSLRFRHIPDSIGAGRVCSVAMASSYYAEASYSDAVNKKVNFMQATNPAGLCPLMGEIPLTTATTINVDRSLLNDSISISLL